MSNKTNILIIDDHKDTIDVLERFLYELFPNKINLLKRAYNIDNGFKACADELPDLLFLDVEMPGGTGFDLIKKLKEQQLYPTIIFITAYNEYAIEAIRNSAFDFLEKPIDKKELEIAFYRFLSLKQKTESKTKQYEIFLRQTSLPAKIKFNNRQGYVFIHPNEIMYCKADGNYTYLYLVNDKKEYVTLKLGEVHQLLNNTNYLRIGRSLIINTHVISQIDRLKKTVTLNLNGTNYGLELTVRQIRELCHKI